MAHCSSDSEERRDSRGRSPNVKNISSTLADIAEAGFAALARRFRLSACVDASRVKDAPWI